MNWTELEKTWQAQLSDFAPPAWSLDEFETRRRSLARGLARRDWLEAGASAGASVVLAGVLVLLGSRDWRGWLAIALILAVGVRFIVERRRTARLRLPPEAPLVAQLEAEIAELRYQARLLHSVLAWYLAPIGAAIGLYLWALARHIAAAGVAVEIGRLLVIGGGAVALVIGVWWLNRHTVRTWIEPQLAAREKARADLLRG
ncbi:MAG: hypothetical protein C0518_10795 [Opitutus sp.]|nr:hypothetical protein [Opitutus sp.]